jgi:uncharacterized membrane protein
MQSEPVKMVVASFRYEVDANAALKDLEVAAKQNFAHVRDMALLTRDKKDNLRLAESDDKGFGHGAMIGGLAGAAAGLLAGPIGWAALGGAAIGGVASKLRDTGLPDKGLRQLGEGLEQGSAILVAVVDPSELSKVQRILEQYGGQVTSNDLSPEVVAQLERDARDQQDSTSAKGS